MHCVGNTQSAPTLFSEQHAKCPLQRVEELGFNLQPPMLFQLGPDLCHTTVADQLSSILLSFTLFGYCSLSFCISMLRGTRDASDCRNTFEAHGTQAISASSRPTEHELQTLEVGQLHVRAVLVESVEVRLGLQDLAEAVTIRKLRVNQLWMHLQPDPILQPSLDFLHPAPSPSPAVPSAAGTPLSQRPSCSVCPSLFVRGVPRVEWFMRQDAADGRAGVVVFREAQYASQAPENIAQVAPGLLEEDKKAQNKSYRAANVDDIKAYMKAYRAAKADHIKVGGPRTPSSLAGPEKPGGGKSTLHTK